MQASRIAMRRCPRGIDRLSWAYPQGSSFRAGRSSIRDGQGSSSVAPALRGTRRAAQARPRFRGAEMPLATLRRYFRHGLFPQLVVFEAVARLGSVTRAANELHLAQPTVSMQLKKLSQTLEV